MEKQISILIADEDKNWIDETSKSFSNEYLIETVIGGEDLMKKLEEKEFDVLIMDVLLSKIDGFAILEAIKEKGLKTKVIVISNLYSNTFIQKAINLGASYYMIKPVSTSVLIARVQDVLMPASVQFESMSRSSDNAKTKQLEEKITNIFITVGIPAHIKGYQFLREAIKMAIANPDIINSITKKLYPSIADRFATSSSKVERAIRHAIEVAWNRGKIENINSVFGLKVYSSNEKPTNGEFIALVADKMLMEG